MSLPNHKAFHLSTSMKTISRFTTLFGFGKLPSSSPSIAKILYAAYTTLVFGLITLTLIRLFIDIDYSRNFNLHTASHVLTIIYAVQSLFSAYFLISKTHRGAFGDLTAHWSDVSADELISETNFSPRIKYLWICPVLIFLAIIILAAVGGIFVEFYHLITDWSTKPMGFWQIYLLIPAAIFGVLAWAIPFYSFYVVCLATSYAWSGFRIRIEKMNERKDQNGFDEERLLEISSTHMRLTELTETVSRVYGSYACVMILLAVPDLFLQLYMASRMPPDPYARGQTIVWFLLSLGSVVILFSGSMVRTNSSIVPEIFYDHYYEEVIRKEDKDDTGVSEKLLLEISMLLTRMYDSHIYVSALDWFIVSKETLASIFSILSMGYFVFLMDYSVPEQKCTNGTVVVNGSDLIGGNGSWIG